MTVTKSPSDSAQFKTLLRNKGIFEALKFLNSRSSHRFSALYIFDGASLKNVCLVDKENDSVRQMETISVTDSYCFFVRDSGQKFITPDSLSDSRVQGHPKQEAIQSYCGMPIVGGDMMLGTLCHFDFSPLDYSEAEVDLLEQITPELARWLQSNIQAEDLRNISFQSE